MSGRGRDGFYVGYRPLPRAHRVFLLVAVPLALAGMIVGALGLSAGQADWGDGVWQSGAAGTWEGTLALQPYPMLHVGGEHGVETYLLVEMGKFGARDRFAGADRLDGAAVSIRGRELRREGRRMIEIDPDEETLGPPVSLVEGASAVRAPLVAGNESISLRGEIMDGKCYLGAMKPGTGRGHKACATLCIVGGIPPVLVSRGWGGSVVFHLLADNEGGPLAGADLDRLKPLIGEPVVLTGRTGRVGSWGVLLLDGLPGGGGGVPSPGHDP